MYKISVYTLVNGNI